MLRQPAVKKDGQINTTEMSSVGVRDYSVSEGNIPSIIASRVDSSVQLRSGQSVQKELRRGKDDSRGTMSNSHIGRNEREQVCLGNGLGRSCYFVQLFLILKIYMSHWD